VYKHHDRLRDWKDDYPVFGEVHSRALQRTVSRFYDNLSNLNEKKQNGYKVGRLRWKAPREYQSMTYSQSGFELKTRVASIRPCGSRKSETFQSATTGHCPKTRRLKKSRSNTNEVTVKHESTGEWFVSFALDVDDEHFSETGNR